MRLAKWLAAGLVLMLFWTGLIVIVAVTGTGFWRTRSSGA